MRGQLLHGGLLLLIFAPLSSTHLAWRLEGDPATSSSASTGVFTSVADASLGRIILTKIHTMSHSIYDANSIHMFGTIAPRHDSVSFLKSRSRQAVRDLVFVPSCGIDLQLRCEFSVNLCRIRYVVAWNARFMYER